MPLPLGPLFLAGATAAIGYFFQENSAKNTCRRQNADAERDRDRLRRKAELTRAQELFRETVDSLCELHLALELYFPSLMATEEEDKEGRAALYKEMETVYRKWKAKEHRILGMVRACFGNAIADRLDEIANELRLLFEECLMTKAFDGIDLPGKKFNETVQSSSSGIQELVCQMLKQIQDHAVGSLRRGTRS